MTKSKRHGYLLVGDKPMTIEQLASNFGQSRETTAHLLAELRDAQVFSMEGEIIFSRRMTRDEDDRKSNRDKVLRWRNHNVTEKLPECNQNVTPQRLETRDQKPEYVIAKKRFVPPTEQEWVAFAKEKHPEWEINNIKSAWAHYESIGWKTNTKSFTKWKSCVATCYHGWKQRQTTQKGTNNKMRQNTSVPLRFADEPWDYFVAQGYGTADDWIAAGRPSDNDLKYYEDGRGEWPDRLKKYCLRRTK